MRPFVCPCLFPSPILALYIHTVLCKHTGILIYWYPCSDSVHQYMRIKPLTKKQIEEHLAQQPLAEVLQTTGKTLTTKQLNFCEKLARGDTKAEAYRKAYNSKGKPQTQANEGYKLANRPDIATMTEAIKAGLEFQSAYSLKQIRSLIVERLTVEAMDGNSSPSARISALKTLGEVAGIDAYIHRTETKVIKDSTEARDELMAMLKASLADQARTIEVEDDDIAELMGEINGHPSSIAASQERDPHPHEPQVGVPPDLLHTNPDIQSSEIPEISGPATT